MSVTEAIKRQVWVEAGGCCCKCKMYLLKTVMGNSNKSAQGEVAHIEGDQIGAKRYNSAQTEEQRNSLPNLMLMCPNHHTEIDSDETTFTVPVLVKMKSEHEKWVKTQLKIASFNISFAELEVVLQYLSDNSFNKGATNYNLIPPIEKISKNNLSPVVSDYITMGMIRTELVQDYLNRNPDINFANRLRKGFVEKYEELMKTVTGDELFFTLLDFASGSKVEFPNQAAALTVLVYFFQICDVFES